MNILEIEDMVKGLPDQALQKEAKQPTGRIPQFLVVSEIQRRGDMRQRFQKRQENQGTVKDQVMQQGIAAMGAPQPEMQALAGGPPMPPQGMPPQGMQQPMPPQAMPQGMPQQPPMGMYAGGVVQMANGKEVPFGGPGPITAEEYENDPRRLAFVDERMQYLQDLKDQGFTMDDILASLEGSYFDTAGEASLQTVAGTPSSTVMAPNTVGVGREMQNIPMSGIVRPGNAAYDALQQVFRGTSPTETQPFSPPPSMIPTQDMYDQNVGGFKRVVDQDPSGYPNITQFPITESDRLYAQELSRMEGQTVLPEPTDPARTARTKELQLKEYGEMIRQQSQDRRNREASPAVGSFTQTPSQRGIGSAPEGTADALMASIQSLRAPFGGEVQASEVESGTPDISKEPGAGASFRDLTRVSTVDLANPDLIQSILANNASGGFNDEYGVTLTDYKDTTRDGTAGSGRQGTGSKTDATANVYQSSMDAIDNINRDTAEADVSKARALLTPKEGEQSLADKLRGKVGLGTTDYSGLVQSYTPDFGQYMPDYERLISSQEDRAQRIRDEARKEAGAQALIQLGAGIAGGNLAGGISKAGQTAADIRRQGRKEASAEEQLSTRMMMAQQQARMDLGIKTEESRLRTAETASERAIRAYESDRKGELAAAGIEADQINRLVGVEMEAAKLLAAQDESDRKFALDALTAKISAQRYADLATESQRRAYTQELSLYAPTISAGIKDFIQDYTGPNGTPSPAEIRQFAENLMAGFGLIKPRDDIQTGDKEGGIPQATETPDAILTPENDPLNLRNAQ